MSTSYYPKKNIKFEDILDNEELLKKEHGITLHIKEENDDSGTQKIYFFMDPEENYLRIYPNTDQSHTTFCRYGLNQVSHMISILGWVFDTPILDEHEIQYVREPDFDDEDTLYIEI